MRWPEIDLLLLWIGFLLFQVVKIVRAIRKGFIKLDKPKEEQDKIYDLWDDDSRPNDKAARGSSYFPPPKPKLAGIFVIVLLFISFV